MRLRQQLDVGLGLHCAPDGDVALDRTCLPQLVSPGRLPEFDEILGEPVRDKAGALEVPTKVANECRVSESNPHLPQILPIRPSALGWDHATANGC